ncbi:hypothetical protein BGM25_25130 [Bacillus sp. FJAT-29953]|nr:hypothetical protein [Bacillus sp. FJAT-29953]
MAKFKSIWKNFLAYDIEEFRKDITHFFEVNSVKGNWEENSGSYVLSNKKGQTFIANHSTPFKLSLIKATASPVERLLINFTGNSDKLENVCFIIIETVDKEDFRKVKQLLSQFFNQLDKKPWDLKSHPMFQFAWILRLNVKRRWKNFLIIEN